MMTMTTTSRSKAKAASRRSATKTSRRSKIKAAAQPTATKKTPPPATKPAPEASAQSSATLIVLGYDDQQKPRGARFVGADPDLVKKAAAALDLKVYEVAPSSDLADVAKKLPVGRIHASGQGLVPNVGQDLYSEVLVALAVHIREADDPATPVAKGLPKTWDEIGPGHLVVAQETLEYGWWEAIVIARAGDMFTLRYRDFPKLPKFVRPRSAIALMNPATT
jgi:hypothetical protein